MLIQLAPKQMQIDAIVRLDPSKPRGLARGMEGEIRSGFEFYRKEGKTLHFITIAFGQEPVITAVTEDQFRLWKGVVAIPMSRIYKDGLWREILGTPSEPAMNTINKD